MGEAAKRRHIHSLGREPQDTKVAFPISPEGATELGCGVSRSHHRWNVCRRFAAYSIFWLSILGLTPQAMSLSLLRSSRRSADAEL